MTVCWCFIYALIAQTHTYDVLPSNKNPKYSLMYSYSTTQHRRCELFVVVITNKCTNNIHISGRQPLHPTFKFWHLCDAPPFFSLPFCVGPHGVCCMVWRDREEESGIWNEISRACISVVDDVNIQSRKREVRSRRAFSMQLHSFASVFFSLLRNNFVRVNALSKFHCLFHLRSLSLSFSFCFFCSDPYWAWIQNETHRQITFCSGTYCHCWNECVAHLRKTETEVEQTATRTSVWLCKLPLHSIALSHFLSLFSVVVAVAIGMLSVFNKRTISVYGCERNASSIFTYLR